MVLELLADGLWLWVIWIAVTFISARKGGWQGVLVAHFVVAVMVVASDVAWVQAEINKPEWTGSPDQDLLFHWGCLFRVILVNSLLLPVGILGIVLRARSVRRAETKSVLVVEPAEEPAEH